MKNSATDSATYTITAKVADITAPALSDGTALRVSGEEATVTFTSSEVGVYYYEVVPQGDREPNVSTDGPGESCAEGANTIILTGLSAGAQDVYIKGKDAAGNVSGSIKITVPADSHAELSVRATGGGDLTLGTDYLYAGGTLTVLSATPMTIANTDPNTATGHKIVVASPQAAITLDGVNISTWACALRVEAGSAASITLSGTNTLKSDAGRAGLEVPETSAVSIDGSGSLIARGGDGSNYRGQDGGAGIGGSYNGVGGTIKIKGGTVEANSTGIYSGAGIGSGYVGSIETIEISGGVVTAASNKNGAGIGAGAGGRVETIKISGGTVMATGGDSSGGGGNSGAGIGGGTDSNVETIKISGGTVTAAGGIGGAGIGSGGKHFNGGHVGDITVDGNAVVFATGGEGSDHIGASSGGSYGTKVFTEGVVFEGSSGTVYGSPELPGNMTIPAGSTLTVPHDAILTNSSALTNDGEVKGGGTLTGDGSFGGSGTYTLKVFRVIGTPTAAAITKTGVTLNAVTLSRGDGAVQYAVSATDSAPTEPDKWQDTPVFDHLTPGTDYYFFARVTGSRIYQDVVTSGVKIKTTETARYSLSASPSTLDFGSATEGYSAPAAQTVTIHNTGNRSVTLTKPGSASYTVGDFLPDVTVAAGGTAAFTVQPKTGLGVGTYDETLIIGDSGGASATVSLNFSVTAKNTGGGGGSSGGGGGSVTVEPSKPTEQDPNPPTVGVITPPATVDKDGSVKVDVSDKDIQNAIDKAVQQAKKDGAEANGIAVSINLAGLQSTFYHLPLTLSKNAYGLLVNAGVKYISIITPQISLSLDLATLKTIYAAATGDVTIDAVQIDRSKLSNAARTALGSRPAYDLTITCKDKTISQFGGHVAITLPYTLHDRERGGELQMVWLDDGGQVRYMTGSSYSADNKAMLGRTDHFTVFGIAEKPAPAFTDIDGHWAKDDILFVASRELMGGTGDKVFSPNGSMTRGMFVTALGRLAGVDPKSDQTGRFTDVKADAYYAPFVNWAAAKGIVNGTGATTFAPDQPVTRQEMASIMQNYAGALGYTLPITRVAVTFADDGSIASWAKDAVRAMQQAGILMGKEGNCFDPTGTATRAEVSALLHRFVELIIDPATAQGWDRNDSGKWVFYVDGRAVTGARVIDGTTYHFDEKGQLTKIDAAAPETKKYITYKVQKDDTLWSIAQEYNCTVAEIVALNKALIADPNQILVGWELKIPQK